MQGLLKDHLVICADSRDTCYCLTCSICGAVWKMTAHPGMDRISAAQEAAKQAHMCPFCGRPVCNNCFDDVEGITLCAQCARKLRERIEV